MILLELFYEFFIIGLFMFGGGLAAIPFLQQMSEKTGWFTVEQLMDMIAVSGATPGPIRVNLATYVGYIVAGVPGGIVATVGLIAPSVAIALIVARLLARFRESALMDSALYGFRPASLALIATAGLTILRLSLLNTELWEQTGAILDLFDFKAVALAVALLILTNVFKAHPIIYLAGGALIGIIIF